MNDVTRMLDRIEEGDGAAAGELFPIVYEELRRLAADGMRHERRSHTLGATALVHEAYLRLVGPEDRRQWKGRGHFFAAAARAMRRVLLNHARDCARQKRGGDRQRVDLSSVSIAVDAPPEILIALDDAVDALTKTDPAAAELVTLRFYSGLPQREACEVLGITYRELGHGRHGDRLGRRASRGKARSSRSGAKRCSFRHGGPPTAATSWPRSRTVASRSGPARRRKASADSRSGATRTSSTSSIAGGRGIGVRYGEV